HGTEFCHHAARILFIPATPVAASVLALLKPGTGLTRAPFAWQALHFPEQRPEEIVVKKLLEVEPREIALQLVPQLIEPVLLIGWFHAAATARVILAGAGVRLGALPAVIAPLGVVVRPVFPPPLIRARLARIILRHFLLELLQRAV